MGRAGLSSLALLAGLACGNPALAQTASTTTNDIAALRAELEALQARQDALAARIEQLSRPGPAQPAVPVTSITTPTVTSVPPQAVAATIAATGMAGDVGPGLAQHAARVVVRPSLTISGDVRLRYEINTGTAFARDRHRWVMRGRLRGQYAPSSWLRIGAQVTTGDAGDPNSSDVTLGNFVDDLPVNLDQIYVSATSHGFTLTGGKFAMPFQRTDLVWDGDVSPQGLALAYDQGTDDIKLGARFIFFPIEEAVAGKDSRMIGGQALANIAFGTSTKLKLAAGYYDYRLASLAAADSGDIRGNRFVAGHYLSDYDLANLSAILTLGDKDSRWPLVMTGDYVHNFGAPETMNDGWFGEIAVGRTIRPGDWRFSYGYMRAGQDAVLAAFAHDNIGLSTDDRLHQLTLDHLWRAGITFSLYGYRYRHLSTLASPDPWQNRLRLSVLFAF